MGEAFCPAHAIEVVHVPVLELGPVSSHIVRICNRSLSRLFTHDAAVGITVEEGTEAPRLGPAGVANLTVAPFSATEKADVAELRALRSALYGDTAR
jgi:hypothetical protein